MLAFSILTGVVIGCIVVFICWKLGLLPFFASTNDNTGSRRGSPSCT